MHITDVRVQHVSKNYSTKKKSTASIGKQSMLNRLEEFGEGLEQRISARRNGGISEGFGSGDPF